MVKDIEVGWSGYMLYTLLAVKENWKELEVDLYIAEFINMLRMRPDLNNIHIVMFGDYHVMVIA